MVRLIVLVILAALAVGLALLIQRRRPDPPSAPSYRAPVQLDRDDFDGPAKPFLLVVFASIACNTCPEVWAAVEPLASARWAVQRIDVEHSGALHERYRIDGVPTTVLAGPEGVVTATFFGPLDNGRLHEAIAELEAIDR